MKNTTLKQIWIEKTFDGKTAIRIDWSNDRHQRIEIKKCALDGVVAALKEAILLIQEEVLTRNL